MYSDIVTVGQLVKTIEYNNIVSFENNEELKNICGKFILSDVDSFDLQNFRQFKNNRYDFRFRFR